ncbi:TPA: hypothetical protein ACOXWE_004558 [Salmonella enterica]
MKRSLLIVFTLSACIAAADAAQTRYFFRDPGAIKISLDEPATGCRMNGQMIHPIEKPAAKVIWFTERECGTRKQAVSLVSDELDAPDNVIHKGHKMHVVPAKVEIVGGGRI